MTKHLFAVYGTLKKGFGNNRILQDSKFLGEEIVPGFKMYSLGGFPAINKCNDDSTIKVEIFEVTDQSVIDRVYRLEHYSGVRDNANNWYDTTDVPTNWGNAEIFYFKEDLHQKRQLVEGGNWQ